MIERRVTPQGSITMGSDVSLAADATLYFAELDACKRPFNVKVGGRGRLTLHSGTEAARAP